MMYKFNVSGDRIILNGCSSAVSGSKGYYNCEFTFSQEWENLIKFAVFIQNENSYKVEISDNMCPVPYEITKETGTVAIGVFGTEMRDENPIRISTDFAHIIVKEGAFRDAEAPSVPSADLWEVYFDRARAEATQIAINAGIAAAEVAKGEFAQTLGDLDAALDNIISIQNALIGGENA